MRSQNLAVAGPVPPEHEHPKGKALAAKLAAALTAVGIEIVEIDTWRDSGMLLRTAESVDVSVAWVNTSREWFLQIVPRAEASFEQCTRTSQVLADVLASEGGFSNFRWAVDADPSTQMATVSPQPPQLASTAGIAFPALVVSRGHSFVVVDRLPTSGTVKALLSGYFHRLSVLDRDGHLWPVVYVEPDGPGIVARIFNRVIPITLFVGKPENAQASEVAEELCDLVDSDPDDLYGQHLSPAQLKALFRSATTACELIAIAARI